MNTTRRKLNAAMEELNYRKAKHDHRKKEARPGTQEPSRAAIFHCGQSAATGSRVEHAPTMPCAESSNGADYAECEQHLRTLKAIEKNPPHRLDKG